MGEERTPPSSLGSTSGMRTGRLSATAHQLRIAAGGSGAAADGGRRRRKRRWPPPCALLQALGRLRARAALLGIGGDPAQLAQRISSNIQKITQCSVEIQRTLNQLGTPQDSPELRQQLQQKQQYTNQLAKETDKYIKEFGSLPTTPSEQRQRKIQKDRLVAEFTTSLTNFQKVQRQAAEREKEFVARVRASSRVSADIMDINEIFKDLGMMIHEQGDVIDSIEANVESAEVHVQQANQQLSRAADYQVMLTVRNFIITLCLFTWRVYDRECVGQVGDVCKKSGLKRLEMLHFKFL
ncbi:Syntaxin-7 [Tupaia chinensis]|uniref:Syntaxin-7 n=1 Tax=Tupaia chinensis TaxID=246437 RepID=L9L2Y6_TUPCH|nr:Syntaxin-7 [Tupaia chinensis]